MILIPCVCRDRVLGSILPFAIRKSPVIPTDMTTDETDKARLNYEKWRWYDEHRKLVNQRVRRSFKERYRSDPEFRKRRQRYHQKAYALRIAKKLITAAKESRS